MDARSAILEYARPLVAGALARAAARGARYADVRFADVRTVEIRVRDGRLQGSDEHTETGVGVRVLHGGSWGFAAGPAAAVDDAAGLADRACASAAGVRGLLTGPVEPAEEPVHGPVDWTSSYELDPFDVPADRRVARLQDWSDALLGAPGVDHVHARVLARREDTLYADLAGTVACQRRIWVHPMVTAVRLDRSRGGFTSLRTLGPPTGRGWEYLEGTGWDWKAELAAMPGRLAEKAAAPAVRPGTYDLVVDPTNLWLTIHESVGHATELDRMLGHEAAYAGTSFVSPWAVGRLRYGSALMNVRADRTTEHGLATVGYDDEGVAAQSWDLVRDGVLVGTQTDRRTARLTGHLRSRGCAYADSFRHLPALRMPNVSLLPAAGGPSTEELIADVRDGLYVVGDDSWSIDMQRCAFQFTGQRFRRIRHGRVAGPVRDAAYQGSSLEFWRSLAGVGGPQTYLLAGASACGKAQPGQLAAVGHGCPATLFRGVRIVDPAREAG
jgi:TldD protein